MADLQKVYDKYRVRYRDELTCEQEESFANDCFDIYEAEGFADVFHTNGGDFDEYDNKAFEVVRRATKDDCDIECLPMWKIRFKNGFEICAYPDEIIQSEVVR